MYTKFVIALILSLFLCSCHSKYNALPVEYDVLPIEGKISNGRFYDKNGWYSVQIPSSLHKVTDFYNSYLSVSSFLDDDSGDLIRFEVTKIPEEYISPNAKSRIEEGFSCIFEDCAVKLIKHQFPNTLVTHQEYIENMGEVFYFSILHIPNGSTVENLDTHERLDSTRGYLMFLCGNELVVLSNQISPLIEKIHKNFNKKIENEFIFKELLKARSYFRNEDYVESRSE